MSLSNHFHHAGARSKSERQSLSNRQHHPEPQTFSEISNSSQHTHPHTSQTESLDELPFFLEYETAQSNDSERVRQLQESESESSDDRFLDLEDINRALSYPPPVTITERNDMLQYIADFEAEVHQYDIGKTTFPRNELSQANLPTALSDNQVLNYLVAFNTTSYDLWGNPSVQDLVEPPQSVRFILCTAFGPAVKQKFEDLLDERHELLVKEQQAASTRLLAAQEPILSPQLAQAGRNHQQATQTESGNTASGKFSTDKSSRVSRNQTVHQRIVQPSTHHRCKEPGCQRCLKAKEQFEAKRKRLHESDKRDRLAKMVNARTRNG